MRTDPRKACANERELWFWAAVHDLIAHPLMVLTGYSRAALRLHDATSRLAWPRPTQDAQPDPLVMPFTRYGAVTVQQLGPSLFRVQHGRVDHAVTLQAHDRAHAFGAAMVWFDSLAEQLGGKFAPRF